MKKLIMAIAAVACAFGVQAASVQWQFTESAQNSKNPLDISSYTAYLFDSAAWTTVLASDVGAGIDKEIFDQNYSDQKNLTYSVLGNNVGKKWDTGVVTSDGVTGSYYIVLADDNGYIASSALTATQFENPTDQHTIAKWNIGATATPIQSVTGSFANVPEPTSSILLLLGMAGLALKRKHA